MSEAIFPGTTPTLSFTFPDAIVPQECQKIALILSQNGHQVFSWAEVPPAPTTETGTIEHQNPTPAAGGSDIGTGRDEGTGAQSMSEQGTSVDPSRRGFVYDGQKVSFTLRQSETRAFAPCFSLALELWVKTASGTVPDPWQTSIPVGIVQDSEAV